MRRSRARGRPAIRPDQPFLPARASFSEPCARRVFAQTHRAPHRFRRSGGSVFHVPDDRQPCGRHWHKPRHPCPGHPVARPAPRPSPHRNAPTGIDLDRQQQCTQARDRQHAGHQRQNPLEFGITLTAILRAVEIRQEEGRRLPVEFAGEQIGMRPRQPGDLPFAQTSPPPRDAPDRPSPQGASRAPPQ